MDIMIVNSTNGRTTLYKQSELRKDARFAVKGKGKLVDFFVTFHEKSGRAQLVATYQDKAGFQGQQYVCI